MCCLRGWTSGKAAFTRNLAATWSPCAQCHPSDTTAQSKWTPLGPKMWDTNHIQSRPITSKSPEITWNHLKSPRITQSQEGSGRFLEKFGWLGWPGGNSCTWSLGPFWSASWPCTKCLMACLMASISRALANKVAPPEIKPFKTLLGFLKCYWYPCTIFHHNMRNHVLTRNSLWQKPC